MPLNAFQTLADPARLTIVEALGAGELAVNDLVRRLDIHQSGVSRHLRILHESGFVEMRPCGQKRLYALRPKPFCELDEWLSKYRGFWEARVDRFGEALKQKQNANPGRKKEISK